MNIHDTILPGSREESDQHQHRDASFPGIPNFLLSKIFVVFFNSKRGPLTLACFPGFILDLADISDQQHRNKTPPLSACLHKQGPFTQSDVHTTFDIVSTTNVSRENKMPVCKRGPFTSPQQTLWYKHRKKSNGLTVHDLPQAIPEAIR